MDLSNEFTVPVPVERAWEVLTDVELIAPCLPGAQLQEIEGDEYRGIVKVKVGPITAQYKGAATFQEQDVENRRIVLKAEGRDTRGQGSASALITATMTETTTDTGVSTHVVVDSDVTIKGKVAQFGRGMIAEVSAKLLTQFVECLEGKLGEEPAPAPTEASAPVAPAPTEAASTQTAAEVPERAPATDTISASSDAGAAPKVRQVDHAESKPVDLFETAGASIGKRAAPVALVFLFLLFIGRRRSKKRRS
ncbi:MAG: SRPBCC domain-containing protein [Acidimicrobiales bacterium]